MSHKLGLKLWSVNTDFYYEEAKKIYKEGVFDYVELYVVPNTLDTLPKWKELEIPFIIHAPHFDSGANLADRNNEEKNYKIYDEVKLFQEELDAKYVVVHCGIEGNIEETIKQLRKIKLKNLLIENKPFLGPTDPSLHCRGALFEEIKKVIDELNCGFCLDISHCICTANFLKVDPYNYIEKFNAII